jgi:peptidyl-prolyl cis-trans isomerase C
MALRGDSSPPASPPRAAAGVGWRIRLAVSFAACLLSAALPAAAQIYGDAARVNGVPISNLRLERFFEDYVKDKGRNIGRMINPRVYKTLKREALDLLIEREVLWQMASAVGIFAEDAEVDAALRAAEAMFRSRQSFLIRLEEAGFDEAGYREHLRRELSGARFLREASAAEPEVSEADIATVYERHRDTLLLPETMRARHILLQVDATADEAAHAAVRQRLEALLVELRNGADFAELARRHSQDSTAAAGGDLGEFTRGRMVRPFEEAAFALRPGEISAVVQTRFGYHLIKAESHSPERVPNFEEARERIRQQLIAERRADQARRIVAQLVADAKIERLVNLDGSR